jgi:hypothetical protein
MDGVLKSLDQVLEIRNAVLESGQAVTREILRRRRPATKALQHGLSSTSLGDTDATGRGHLRCGLASVYSCLAAASACWRRAVAFSDARWNSFRRSMLTARPP